MTTQTTEKDLILTENGQHLENAGEAVNSVDVKPDVVVQDAEIIGQKLSGYEELSWWQTAKTFKLATLYCVLPSLAAAADGYQVSLKQSPTSYTG